MTEAIEIVSKEEQAAIAELGSTGESHLAVAEAMAITDQDSLNAGNDILKIVVAYRKAVVREEDALTSPFKKIKREADIGRKYVIDKCAPLRGLAEKAEAIIKGKAGDFLRIEQAKAAEEKRIADELAEKERLRLETLWIAAEKREADARAAAEATENEAERKRLLAKAEKDREKSEAFANRADTVPTVAPVRTITTPKGMSTPKTWRGEITHLRQFCMAIADGRIPEHIISEAAQAAITVELNKVARSNRDAMSWPGVRFFAVTGIRSRG